MKTSIIIPYHKGDAYLRDCLDSLKEQTGQDMEILLICDHVQKKELNCLSEYRNDLSIQVYHLKDKTGVAAARNYGLKKATGDYIYFLDSDDYLYGNTIENLVLTAQERDSEIIYGRKKPTWFGRSVFLIRKQEEQETEEEEADISNSELAELQAEGEDHQQNKEEDLEDDSSEEEVSQTNVDKDICDDTEENQGDDGLDLYDMGETDENITQEELLRRKEVRRKQAYRILVAKRKGVRNISVLGILFKRSFIEDNALRFPENLKYFSDVPFLLEALSKADCFHKRLSAKYIKRRHNDAINFPSLSQIKDSGRFYEFLDTYHESRKRIEQDLLLRNYFERKYISYYTRVYAPKLKRSKNSAWREDNFTLMSDIINQINPEVLNSLKGYKKRVIRALKKKKLKKSIWIVTSHLAYVKLKRILRNKKNFIRFCYIHFFLKRPVKQNWILFESFFGKNYSDSPKYIYEYLAKNFPGKYKCIWVIDKKNTKIPYKHRKIKRNHFFYSYYLARCRYFVFNGRQPEWVVKRSENVFLQTWHGTPLKKLVFDMDEITSATPKYKQQVYKQSRAWDYLIAPNDFSSKTFRRCFMYENSMLETGYPRNDILHAPDRNEVAEKIRKRLRIPENKKTILYAPTWRDDEFYGKGKYKFELHLNLEMMHQYLGEDYVVLLRTHYFIADAIDVSSLKGFAYNLSKYDDISELYLISDLLITDYSSVFFDYANLKRPMLFFTYDLEKYRDVLRGFYFDIEKEVPGPLLYTTEEVIDAIRQIDEIQREYSPRYEEFYHRFCDWEDGHAAEKVVKSVFEDKEN